MSGKSGSIEKRVELWEAINRLPPTMQRVLKFYLAGFTTAEIARLENMRKDAVRQAKSRALRRVTRMLTEHRKGKTWQEIGRMFNMRICKSVKI